MCNRQLPLRNSGKRLQNKYLKFKKMNKILKILIAFSFFFGVCCLKSYASVGVEGGIIERTSLLVLQVGFILFAARIGSHFFYKKGLPSVLGEIIAGVIIGPYCLGQIPFFGFEQGLFPLIGTFPVTVELYSFATIASIILLFFVGLETDITTFLKFSVAGSIVGVAGVVVSFAAGDFLGILLSEKIIGIQVGFLHPIPLFLGVISTATSVGITAQILSEKRKMNSPEGVTILAAAVVDDVLGIIILAVVLGMSKSSEIHWQQISMIAVKAIGIWLGFTILGLKYSRKITTVLKKIDDRSTIAVISLAIALLLAGIFERSGLAMIIGSYVAGLSLSKTDISFIVQEKLESLQRFFVPVFFCVMGMLINLKSMASWDVLSFGMIYVFFAVVSKLIGCSIPALLLNFNLRGALRIGVGMIPRGEVALIIAGVGLSSGIINDEIFSLVMIMTFITTLITPLFLSKMLDVDKPVLVKEKAEEVENKRINFKMPNLETAELLLNKVISAFENEGFYVHKMPGQARLYQVRKEEVSIVFNYSPERLTFDCLAQEAAFVHTLFYEVIAELENAMRNLQTLTDRNLIGKKIFDSEEASSEEHKRKFQIASSLAISANLKGQSKGEILYELIDLLIISKQLESSRREEAYQDLIGREEIMSTGMQEGIAIPHAKTTVVDHVMVSMGISKGGVDFNSLDKKLSKIFVLTLASKENPHAYLQSMSEISQFLGKEENRGKVLACDTSMKLFELFNTL